MKSNLDLQIINNLITTVSHLSNFDDVRSWDTQAKQQVDNISGTLLDFEEHKSTLEKDLINCQTEHQNRGFFARMFNPDPKIKLIKKTLRDIEGNRVKLLNLKDTLEDWIERTPDDETESKQMLKELKLIKKELGVTKKELRLQMKGVTTSTRIKNANISNQFFTSPKLKRIQRISARMDKESSLKPLEKEVCTIDKQILEIDKTINWIEKIRF